MLYNNMAYVNSKVVFINSKIIWLTQILSY